MPTRMRHKTVKVNPEAFMRMLKRCRLAHGMTLAKIGRQLNVATNTVQAWESGRNLPRPDMFPKLARVLGVEPMELTRMLAPDDIPSKSN